jgi:hypothetical protein
MIKLANIFGMFFVLLVSGYIGGAAFSFIFVILGYKLAGVISFIIGVLAGIIFVLMLLYVRLFKNDENNENYIAKIQRSYEPSKN